MKKITVKVLTPEFHTKVSSYVEKMIVENSAANPSTNLKKKYEAELRLFWLGARELEKLSVKLPDELHKPEWSEKEVELTDKVTLAGHPVIVYEGEEISVYTLPIFDAKYAFVIPVRKLNDLNITESMIGDLLTMENGFPDFVMPDDEFDIIPDDEF